MADSRKRADVSSRTNAPDAWDAGLHAESEAGPIDVGLSVEPSALGLIIDAPGIGLLKLAFDVKPDGTTRLSRASRRLTDGRDASLVAIDESKVLQLEGALERLQKTHEELTGTLLTERDEARDRAAVISEDRKDLKEELKSVRAQLSSLTADLQTEKDGRLMILAEREKARAELDRFREEQDAGSTTLMGELTQVRARLDQKDAQLTVVLEESRQKVEAAAEELVSTQEKIAELAAALDESREKLVQLEAARARVTELETRLAATESAYLGSSSQISAERDDARARVAALDDAVQQETEARELALATARREREELATELAEMRSELEALRSKPSDPAAAGELEASYAARTQLEAEVQALRAAMEEGGSAQLTSDLEASYAARTQLETENATLRATAGEVADADALRSELETVRASHAQLETDADALRADLETVRAAHAQLETETAALRASAVTDGDALRAALETTQAAHAQLKTELESARAAQSELETEVATLRASSGDNTVTQTQLMADLEAASAARATLEGEVETLRAGAGERTQLKADLEIALAARAAAEAELEATRTQLTADLEASNAARTQLESDAANELVVAAETRARLEAELSAARAQPTADPEQEARLNEALTRSEAMQAQLAAAEARMGAESAATREARDVALKLKAQADKLQAERDEARALARQLHLKLAAPKKNEADDLRTALDAERQVAANLVAERDQLNLRIEALGRMIDQERDGRARAMSERDEWQLRFKSLARGSVDTAQKLDFSREETRSFMLERPTVPEMPAAKAEAVTDPAIPKKKGF
ncbi:MAG: hypothetical protein Q8K32_10110 [Archangium sp.]|nr:hypothetical protein [Archangium sp.]